MPRGDHTHVANATGKVIWAKVGDYKKVKEFEASLSILNKGSGGASASFEYARIGFTKISNREYYRFPTNGDAVVAVYTADHECICGPTRVKKDHSVIATMGGLKLTQYGSIWKDEQGHTW